MYLVDTSVWLRVFRRDNPLDLEREFPLDEVAICLPVMQEVLQGFRDERAFRVAREALEALPMVEAPLSADVVLLAVDLYRSARRAGITVRSSADCLIAACAIRSALVVVHDDRDFPALARVSPLLERKLPA